MAKIIRDVLTEFGANRPGFAWQDPELDHLSSAYARDGRQYLVIETHEGIVGGGGIGEFECELEGCCELQKMYLLPAFRGRDWGRQLLQALLNEAQRMGYRQCYLETLSTMTKARRLYLETGFSALQAPLGNSGHNACDDWYLKTLQS